MEQVSRVRLKQEIFNEVNENIKALKGLFPSVVKDGQVDFQALKEELGQFEEVGPEKYGLTWSGKQEAKKLSQQDIIGKTLKYIPEESKNPETTENIYIEGDNLEVLKLLRQNYYKSIKMIYIDPPYNTGNDFVYNDNYNMEKLESDKAEGDVSELGERYTVNSKSSNKYHARWLNMMYPRLKVAKDLLKDDGVIFISIDDNEISNLKKICDEIFGEDNFIANVIWKRKVFDNNDNFPALHEYLLIYCKNINNVKFNLLPRSEEQLSKYKNPDNDPKGKYYLEKLSVNTSGGRYSKATDFEIVNPMTNERYSSPTGNWRFGKETIDEMIRIGRIDFSSSLPRYRVYLSEVKQGVSANTWWDNCGQNLHAAKELKELFNNKVFDTPKPTDYIKKMIYLSTNSDDIVLDFFSGSSSTAHALIKQNVEDFKNRKFILVQIQETYDNKNYKNICDIGKERIRRAGEKIKEENKNKEGIEELDIGFKVFRVSDTNIRWNYKSDNLKSLNKGFKSDESINDTNFDYIAEIAEEITLEEGSMSHKDALDFMPGFKDIDVVYEILLRQRDIPLSANVELLEDIGKRTYMFADSYLVCLEENITVELIEKLAVLNPLPIKFILRDSAFGDDIALKDEAYRRLNILIERNIGLGKKAYTVEFI